MTKRIICDKCDEYLEDCICDELRYNEDSKDVSAKSR